jgi:predicted RNase H-like HicB family nuclease
MAPKNRKVFQAREGRLLGRQDKIKFPLPPQFFYFLSFFMINSFNNCRTGAVMKKFKIIVEKYPDGYVAYPLGLKGVVIGQGDTYEEALTDVKSAIRFHLESFGDAIFENDPPILEAFVAEAGV